MNKSHISIWSEALGTWVAAPEFASARGKRSKAKVVAGVVAALVAGGLGLAGTAHAASFANGPGATAETNAAHPAAGWNNPKATPTINMYATAVGNNAAAVNGGTALGDSASVNDFFGVALGAYSVAAAHSTAVGSGAMASGSGASAFGFNALGSGDFSTSLGNFSTASGTSAVALGNWSTAAGTSAVALGNHSTAAGIGAVVLGDTAAASGQQSIAIGQAAQATADNSVALGANSTTTANLGAAGYNPGARAVAGKAAGEVSMGSSGNLRRVTNVAAGSAITDAVNVSQLDSEAVKSNTIGASVAAALGGGATYRVDGTIIAPSYSVGGTTVSNVGDAITNLDGRTTTNTNNIAQNASNITNLQGQMADAVMYDSSAHYSVTLGGTTASAPVALHNVAAGAVNATGTDAINGSQLYATNQNVTANTASIAANTTNLTSLDSRVSTVDDRVTSIDGRVTNVEGSVTNLTQQLDGGSVGLVQQDATSKVITVARALDGATVDFTGTGGTRTLSGVKAGALGDTSTEAVNGSQLHATNQNVTANTASIATNTTNITNLDDRVTKNTTDLTKLQTQVGDVGTQLSGAVQYDRNIDGSMNFGSVTLGGGQSAGPVILTNVANGTSQYDAVNYGQLSALQDQVTDLNGQVKDLGSHVSNIQPVTPDASSPDSGHGAVINAATPGTGAGSTAVGATASAAADNAVAVGASSAATGVNSTAIGTGSQAGNANSVALGQGSVTDRDNSVSMGSAGNERQITNVAAGTADTDAVNVGQMNSSVAQGVQQANNYTDQRINATNQAVNNLARNAYSGIAAASALTMIPEVDQGKKVSFGIGAATYNGYQAIALGGTARITNNIKVKAGVGMSAGGTTAGIGASYQW